MQCKNDLPLTRTDDLLIRKNEVLSRTDKILLSRKKDIPIIKSSTGTITLSFVRLISSKRLRTSFVWHTQK